MFEAKQTADAGLVSYAQDKVASVRRLHRTSLPIPHAGGVYPPKPLIPILGGMLTFESEWNPALGAPFAKRSERRDGRAAARHRLRGVARPLLPRLGVGLLYLREREQGGDRFPVQADLAASVQRHGADDRHRSLRAVANEIGRLRCAKLNTRQLLSSSRQLLCGNRQ